MNWVRVLVVLVPLLLCPGAQHSRLAFGMSRRTSLSPQGMNFTVEGRITRHSAGKLTLSTEENIIFHVRYDDKTEIKRKDGSPGSAKDFRIGVKIMVEGELTEAGEVVAHKIELLEDASSEKP